MKKFEYKNLDYWRKIFTFKNYAILILACIFVYFLVDFCLEFSGHRVQMVDYGANFNESKIETTLTDGLVSIKVIPSNNDLPKCIATGEGFDNSNEYKLLNEINREREAVGMKPLYHDINLEKAARLRSLEMCENEYMEHERPNGDTWSTAITEDIGVSYVLLGENLARVMSSDSEHDLVKASRWYEMWEESDSHYEIMLTPNFTHAGIGIYTMRTEDGFVSYATAHFADEKSTSVDDQLPSFKVPKHENDNEGSSIK